MQYLFCVHCQKAKDRMMIWKGDSYCLECLWKLGPEQDKKREDEALEGLSALFG